MILTVPFLLDTLLKTCYNHDVGLWGFVLVFGKDVAQFMDFAEKTAEDTYFLPVKQQLEDVLTNEELDFVNEIHVNIHKDKKYDNEIRMKNVPTDSLDYMKGTLSPAEYKKRIVISMAILLYDLLGFCRGFDKALRDGLAEQPPATWHEPHAALSKLDALQQKYLRYHSFVNYCQDRLQDAELYIKEYSVTRP